jgi:hypothetical protein
MDVFYRGSDGCLNQTWWTGTQWSVAKVSKVQMSSAPAPLYGFANGRMDVFYKGPSGTL